MYTYIIRIYIHTYTNTYVPIHTYIRKYTLGFYEQFILCSEHLRLLLLVKPKEYQNKTLFFFVNYKVEMWSGFIQVQDLVARYFETGKDYQRRRGYSWTKVYFSNEVSVSYIWTIFRQMKHRHINTHTHINTQTRTHTQTHTHTQTQTHTQRYSGEKSLDCLLKPSLTDEIRKYF